MQDAYAKYHWPALNLACQDSVKNKMIDILETVHKIAKILLKKSPK